MSRLDEVLLVLQAVGISGLMCVLCRSLGLTLLEAATGRYPYDAAGGPLQLMIQVIMQCPVYT